MSGCFNRQKLHNPDWPGRAPIPFRMEPDCQYTKSDLGQADKGCDGCKHKQTVEPVAPVVVDLIKPARVKWQPMSSCPQGKSVQLLGEGGVPTSGRYMRGSLDFWRGWADFPEIESQA